MASTVAAPPPISRVRRQRLKTFRAVFPADVPRGPGSAPTDSLSGARAPASSSSARPSRAAAITRSIAASAPPSSTPFSSPHASSSSSSSSQHHPAFASASASADQQRWDRAWHVVTARIRLPSSVAVEDSFGALATESQDLDHDAAFHHALALVLETGKPPAREARTEDILAWHGAQVRHHFVHHVLPLLAACAGRGGDSNSNSNSNSNSSSDADSNSNSEVLLGIVETLEAAHRQYSYGLRLIARGFRDDAAAAAAVASFHRDLHALVSNSWTPGLMQALRAVLQHTLRVILASAGPPRAAGHEGPGSDNRGKDVERSRAGLFRLIESLQRVGLAGEKFQVLFAEVMDLCMQDFIRDTYSGVWERPKARESSSRPGTRAGPGAGSGAGSGSGMGAGTGAGTGASTGTGTGTGTSTGTPCMDHLGSWIETCYGRLAVEVLSRLGGHVSWSDVERWRDIATGRLATLRMHELFDIVLHWPRSAGGLDDLALAVTTPQRRLQLTDTFSAALQRRLLHPGRSTLDILKTYISMIRTFHALDHSKVLLDRVVPALKLCLWMRDDAIRIVVTGLLASPEDNHSSVQDKNTDALNTDKDTDTNKDKGTYKDTNKNENKNKGTLVELAAILNEASQQNRRSPDDEDLDWADMAWVPDPVDAGANYKRPRNEDIVGTLINALGLEDVFIKEFQAIVAERLLSPQQAFHQEIRVLGLLKKRFGEGALQNCDVMTRDIADSKRVDAALTRGIQSEDAAAVVDLDSSTQGAGLDRVGTQGASLPAFHAKILSRLFWPSLSKEHFALPAPVAAVQRRYAAGFERLKTSRKLSWLDHLGSARVRLELRDRTVEMECKTYEAAVIYEFQGHSERDHTHAQTHTQTHTHNGSDHNDGGSDNSDDDEPAPQRRCFNDLWQKLMMDEDLLDSALRFWVSHNILRDIGDQTYIVLERLDDPPPPPPPATAPALSATTSSAGEASSRTAAGGTSSRRAAGGTSSRTAAGPGAGTAAADPDAPSPRRPAKAHHDSKDKERRGVYWQFIVGMLTNSSPAMPLAQIGMMMKMLIADGCAWGADELQAFLAERVAEGELEFAGGKYRLPKK